MDFRDSDGDPLISWHDPESAFEAWKKCSAGRPCDYTAITYERLRGDAIQWPCTPDAPGGTERLYGDARFNTDPEYCEEYGRDLTTGATNSPDEYKAKLPGERAFLHAVEYTASPEVPTDEFPLLLTTGRTIYHFHTRTKTGRSPELDGAAPEVWVEVSGDDAEALGVAEGDLAEIESPRGTLQARVRVSGIRTGVVVIPFHYGYWDRDATGPDGGPGREANELTIVSWDPASKQPYYKVGAVRLRKVGDADGPAPAPTVGAPAPLDASVPATVGGASADVSSRLED